MTKRAIVVLFAVLLLASCKSPGERAASTSPVEAATLQYSDPPAVQVGLTVDQAYAAIPHRRTVWVQSESTVPAEERAYLRVMFQVLDEAVAVRVTGLQSFSNQRFEDPDVDGQFDRLMAFVRAMPVPKTLGSYHQHILDALASQRQFFASWKAKRVHFTDAQQIANDPAVRKASADLRAAYGELMAKYPRETQINKDAFFDYHCALDFL